MTHTEDMVGLVGLAAKCEAASGPDREIDVLIAEAVGWQSNLVARARTWSPHNDTSAIVADVERDGYLRGLPAYTASLDAAMTLVPEGWRVLTINEQDFDDELPWVVRLTQRDAEFGRSVVCDAIAATAALALCAAALRARAQNTGGGEA